MCESCSLHTLHFTTQSALVQNQKGADLFKIVKNKLNKNWILNLMQVE